MDAEQLDTVSTDDLIFALSRRSKCLFVAQRPMGDDPECSVLFYASVDGSDEPELTPDQAERVAGLVTRGIHVMLRDTNGEIRETKI